MGRIDSASAVSPIAVFKLAEPDGDNMEAVFGSTVETARRIAGGDSLFLGMYHQGHDREKTETSLRNAVRKPAA